MYYIYIIIKGNDNFKNKIKEIDMLKWSFIFVLLLKMNFLIIFSVFFICFSFKSRIHYNIRISHRQFHVHVKTVYIYIKYYIDQFK